MKLEDSGSGPTVAPYGSWHSPVTTDVVAGQVVGLVEIKTDGEDVYWLEQRPSEQGRAVIVQASTDGGPNIDQLPAPFNSRSKVHEYGGGSYVVSGGAIYFSNFADNGIYVIAGGAEPRLVTQNPDYRYADMTVDNVRGLIYCICEDHNPALREPVNILASVSLIDGSVSTVISGADFYSSPRISPDGSRIAWLSWNHPDMPWDGTELWYGELDSTGKVSGQTLVAGGAEESIFQPEWSGNNTLYFVSDRNGWWNIYRSVDGVSEAVWVKDAEFGQPQWGFGMSTYAFSSPTTIICSYTHDGVWHLASIETVSGRVTDIETAYTLITSVVVGKDHAYFIGAAPDQLPELVSLDLAAGKYEVLKRSGDATITPDILSVGEPVEFPTTDGLSAFALYYPPKNDNYIAPEGELPPLLVACHGGPTAATYSQLSLNVQYWTSRGFAFVYVNYGGSTGYGREYHERLNGKWGVVDVDDCVNCALYLTDIGKADINRLTIHGGSAGGYTALCALTFHEVFAAGASLYGVSDIEALATDTHKFEARYLDRLVGPYPEMQDIYRQRSPIHFADRLSSPVIFFQGLDDKVVPPSQAIMMVDALKSQNIPVAYVPFEGEGHGFRKSASIQRCLSAHLYFYASVFKIELPEEVVPVEIIGLL